MEARPVEGAGRVSLKGEWHREGLPQGRYSLSVLGAAGDAWWSQTLDLRAQTTEIDVRLDIVRLTGTVLLGERPVPAQVVFSGTSDSATVALDADDEGRFSGVLPRPGRWTVGVSLQDPPIERHLRNASVDTQNRPLMDG